MKLTDLKGLGTRTDLEMLRFEGRLVEREGYLVAETPENPGFFWGNLLVFPHAPRPGDQTRWEKLFAQEFAHEPAVRHRTFHWDCPSGDPGAADSFSGYSLEETDVLLLPRDRLLKPNGFNPSLEVRVLKTDTDWEAATLNQLALRPDHLGPQEFEIFKRAQMARYRRMTQTGLGEWFGAFAAGRLIADCGLFLFGPVGRFQVVGTHPDFRRQGGCSTLMHTAAAWGLRTASTLVIAADPGYHAIKIYESLGFRVSEKQWGVCRQPPIPAPSVSRS